jgi:hypothetical protein
MHKYVKWNLFVFIFIIGLFISSSHFIFAASENIILNPSLETADPNDSTLPQNWLEGQWGMNIVEFSYPVTGHNGEGGQVRMFHHFSGDAKWYFTPVVVEPNTQYIFNDYYKATVPTYIVAQFDDGNGNLSYQDLAGVVPKSSEWAQTNVTFTTPTDTKIVTIFHLINSVGTLTTDDFSLSAVPVSTPPVVVNDPPVSGGTPTPVVNVTPTISVSNFSSGHTSGGKILSRIIPGCDSRTTGFSITTGQSCIGNIATTSAVGQVLGAEAYNFSLTLKNGSKGNDVVELQKFLKNAGYYFGNVDGIFGNKVKTALIKFQIANNLKSDGIVGSKVREILNK